MSEPRMVQKYTAKAVENAKPFPKEQYKRIKHMDKIEMAHCLAQIRVDGYKDGYKAGYDAGLAAAKQKPSAAPVTEEG